MRTKKISARQFILDCINKQYELANSPMHFDTFDDLAAYSKEHREWYNEYKFQNPNQYLTFKKYFEEHFYDWKPKSISKRMMREQFAWFNLQYGFGLDFDYKLLEDEG